MSNLNKRTPTGGDVTQSSDMKPAFSEDLFEQMISGASMESAWKHVRANKGAPGIDGLSIDEFPAWAKVNWPSIKEELKDGCYQPTPVRRVSIDKPDGGKRLLGVPTILDRVIQQAITQVLTPIFDPAFSASSYGYRPGRSAQQAIKQVHGMVKSGRRIAVDVDLSKFFDRVNHDLLMTLLGRKVKDKQLLRLIKRYLEAGIMDGKDFIESEMGVPQGGPLSPLLANIMLDPFDKELEKRGHKFARYADDITVLVKSQRAGERVFKSIFKYLENKLKLTVNKTKSRVVMSKKANFLDLHSRKDAFVVMINL